MTLAEKLINAFRVAQLSANSILVQGKRTAVVLISSNGNHVAQTMIASFPLVGNSDAIISQLRALVD